MRSSFRNVVVLAAAGLAASSAMHARQAPTVEPFSSPNPKIDPWVAATGVSRPTEFLVFLTEQADLKAADGLLTKQQKGRFVANRLRETAGRTQAPLLELLSARGVPHRSYWVANMIWVRGDLALAEELAAREDVAGVHANPTVRFKAPQITPAPPISLAEGVEWGITKVRARSVIAEGFRGQGVVIAGQDTGYDWDHPALKNQYRGWNGAAANHNYNWHDSIHSGGGVCGPNSAEPCDDHGHGTHTMGTMVGDDGGGNRIGVAPGARWIGCRNMDQGNGTPTTYSECFQWFIAPTDLNGQNPDPTKAPHVINNSWGCPASEGCTSPDALRTVVENTRAAGILVVVSAGNSGSGCGSVTDPAAIYEASFSVGATSNTPDDLIASFSSRGPVTVDGSNRLKPDVSAPGWAIRSSVPGGGYANFSGTSMAGPHVAGVAGLLLSAYPALRGQVATVETILEDLGHPPEGDPDLRRRAGEAIPDDAHGYGRVDSFTAYLAAGELLTAPSPLKGPATDRVDIRALAEQTRPTGRDRSRRPRS